jgi:hypothetical protein
MPNDDWFQQQNAMGEQDRDQYSGAQWDAWKQEEQQRQAQGTSAGQVAGGCPPDKPFTSRPGPDGRSECAFKPDDCPEGSHVEGTPGTCVGNGGGGGGGGQGAGGGGGAGGVPQFNAPRFTAPTMADMEADPGYQARLKEGSNLLQHSQAAQGMTRTGGSLSDLMKYGQDFASNEYNNVYGRAANTYGLNYQAAKDEFAPQYGGWQTQYGGDLSKWTTNQNAALSKYLQREGNIYGVLNQPMPTWGG